MTKYSSHISTMLGTGALCAALVATPITASLISGSAYALDAYMTENCTSEVLDKLGTTSAKLTTLQIDDNTLNDALNSAKNVKEYQKYAKVFDKFYELESGEWREELEKDIDINDNTAMEARQTKLKEIAAKLEQAMQDAGFEADYLSGYDTAPDSNSKADGALFWVHDEWSADNPESKDYAPIFYALNYQNSDNAIGSLGYSKEDAFLGAVCSATKLDSNFTVNYTTGTNPFVNFSDNTSTDNTDNEGQYAGAIGFDNIIESNDQSIKVSGSSINANYTLNVNIISTNDLKLAGDDFKNSLNQVFYDIFVRDAQDNVISNTGEVEVSIKLPDNMNPKNDFVVYYVPVAANGEYLTDKAEAIKGVKVNADGWLTFTTNHFSVYGIVEYPKNAAPNTGVVAQNENSATRAGVKVFTGIMATLTAAGVGIVARRQFLRKKEAKNSK